MPELILAIRARLEELNVHSLRGRLTFMSSNVLEKNVLTSCMLLMLFF
jgi:hypothetical protein